MNCALYIRVSTTEQAEEGYSISAQKQRLSAYAQSQDWDIIGLYADEGISAKDMNRPDLQRMIQDIKDGHIDVVLVYKLDRLTRSVLDLYEILQIFDKYDCKFKSATEVYDTTTAIGRLFLTLVAALAQWERENLGERVRFGMREKVWQGEWHGGTAPFGYNVIDGKLVIDEKEAMVVRKIFDLYTAEGLSDRRTALELNDLGYLTKKDKFWNEIKVARILKNPVYIGKFRWDTKGSRKDYFVSDGAPKFIDESTFYKAQKLRSARSIVHGRQSTSNYYFSGSLRCARCGSLLKGVATFHGKNKFKHYQCRKRTIKQCDLGTISERLFEKAFISYLLEHYPPHFDEEAKNEIAASAENTNNEEQDNLHSELDRIINRRKKWQYAWANDDISQEEFKARMKEEHEREEATKKRLFELNADENKQLNYEQIKAYLDYFENWDELSDIEKKQHIQLMIEYIIVDKVDSGPLDDRVKIKQIKFR
ncbi:MAG: site-specific recombinase for integration and excision [Neobacillus sp.]|nr:site-specific recombinase for integration and excision [Neobacillus sp.]